MPGTPPLDPSMYTMLQFTSVTQVEAHRKIWCLSIRGGFIKFSLDNLVFFEGYKYFYFSKLEVLPEVVAHSRLKNHNVLAGKDPKNYMPLQGQNNAGDSGGSKWEGAHPGPLRIPILSF